MCVMAVIPLAARAFQGPQALPSALAFSPVLAWSWQDIDLFPGTVSCL